MVKISYVILLLLLCAPIVTMADTGDILHQNCAGVSCSAGTTADPDNDPDRWTRSVETSGCLSGECLKLIGLYKAPGEYGDGNTAMFIGSAIDGYSEITITYALKFVGFPMSGRNFKSIRPFIGSGETDYVFATIAPWFGKDFYMSKQYGDITPTSIFTPVICPDSSPECMTDNEDGTYGADTARIAGYFDDGSQDGFGNYWTTIRHYIKLPTTVTSANGESKLWINGELAFSMVDVDVTDDVTTSFTDFSYYPSSEGGATFEHWMDEMVIYEGYVPPGEGEPTQSLQVTGSVIIQ